MDLSFTDKSKEFELWLEQTFRKKSFSNWITVDSKGTIYHADRKLAKRLGYHMISDFIGLDLHDLLDPKIRVHHRKYFDSWWANPRPLELRKKDDEREFLIFDRDGVGHDVYVAIEPLETHACTGICNPESLVDAKKLAAAQILFTQDMSRE